MNIQRKLENEVVAKAKDIRNEEELAKYTQKLDEDNVLEGDKYEAYLVCFSYHRRMKNVRKCMELYERFKADHADQFLVEHFYAIALRVKESKRNIKEAIRLAKKCRQQDPSHSGVLHNLAGAIHTFATKYESDTAKSNELLIEAKEVVNEAIEHESDYPRFYATRASIYMDLGDFSHAEQDIATAIEMEDSSSNDYPIRLNEYLAIKMDLKFKKELEIALNRTETKMANSAETVKEELRTSSIDIKKDIEHITQEAKKSNIEVLTFFVAVISFIIGSLSMLSGLSVQDSVKVILILAGALLFSVAGFCLLFDSNNKLKRFSLSACTAIFLFAIARYSNLIFF